MIPSFSGPKGMPILGSVPAMNKNRLPFLLQTRAQYGDVAHLRLLNRDVYLVSRPEWIHQILVEQADNFHKGITLKQIGKYTLGEGLLTSEGDFHKQQRKQMQPAFHHTRIAAYAQSMVDLTERMLTQINWHDGAVVDIDHEMMVLTQSIVAKTLFDADISAQADQIGDVISEGIRVSSANVFKDMLIGWLPTPYRRKRMEGTAKLDAVIYGFMEEWRRQGGQDKGDLLSMLLLARDVDGKPMPDKQIRDEALTLFIAGHETTANALAWTWYLLAQHPEMTNNLRAELNRVLGGRAPSLKDLPQLPYNEQVIKEVLRLYPPAWLITRLSVKPVQIGGYQFPAGAIYMVSPYVMHHDAKYFSDPEAFKPERWTQEFEKQLPRFAYFPFGGGPRICIGNSFAMMEAQLILATMAQRYDLTLLNNAPVQSEPLITLRPKTPIQMRLTAVGNTAPAIRQEADHPDLAASVPAVVQ
ncbi:MAG: cytochrome P450 [Anaerolineae bacterium]|nr:cytochrome P450 [Anaerolineae bacterium]